MLMPDLSRFRTRADSLVGAARPTTAFVNHLARSRVNYQFMRALSLRLILDYNGVQPNPALPTWTGRSASPATCC